ncbi:MAG: site-2 protease family protein [Planctomycetota bacterium]|jgi:Zn-dependent protease
MGLAFFVLYWVVFVYSVVLHEVAHGWVAFQLGDPTAQKAGRLTLDPIKHIDPVQSIVMPLVLFVMSKGTFIFGGAKPVPVNPYLYKNMRMGTIMDAAAGPVTNLLIAAFFGLGVKVSLILSGGEITATAVFLSCCMMINVFLAAFNLLPVPPLDGSHILESVLPRQMAEAYGKLRYMGFTLIILLLVIPPSRDVIRTGMSFVIGGFLRLMGIVEPPGWNPMDLLRIF